MIYSGTFSGGLMKFKAIIFDLDGTLLNTLEDLFDSMNHVLDAYGHRNITLEQARSYVGNGIERFLELSLPQGKDNKDFVKCLQLFKAHYSINMENKTKPYDGVIELLKEIKQRNYKTAIVSNKFNAAVKQMCPKYFNGYIDVAIGESEKVRKKPAPDSIYMALEQLGVDKSQACYIGDSDVDANTAGNAGMVFVGVSWGFRDKELLYSLGAVTVIDRPEQLLDII